MARLSRRRRLPAAQELRAGDAGRGGAGMLGITPVRMPRDRRSGRKRCCMRSSALVGRDLAAGLPRSGKNLTWPGAGGAGRRRNRNAARRDRRSSGAVRLIRGLLPGALRKPAADAAERIEEPEAEPRRCTGALAAIDCGASDTGSCSAAEARSRPARRSFNVRVRRGRSPFPLRSRRAAIRPLPLPAGA